MKLTSARKDYGIYGFMVVVFLALITLPLVFNPRNNPIMNNQYNIFFFIYFLLFYFILNCILRIY